jgi:hypothetical protein
VLIVLSLLLLRMKTHCRSLVEQRCPMNFNVDSDLDRNVGTENCSNSKATVDCHFGQVRSNGRLLTIGRPCRLLDINLVIKRFNRMSFDNRHSTLEQLLEFDDNKINRFELRLVRSYPPSDDYRRTLNMSHRIYQRYQMAIHGDTAAACSQTQFERFLGQSSLVNVTARSSSMATPSCGYGSFHLQYYINDRLIACSVIDVLPAGLSSVYFYYEPDLACLKLGVYSALR